MDMWKILIIALYSQYFLYKLFILKKITLHYEHVEDTNYCTL